MGQKFGLFGASNSGQAKPAGSLFGGTAPAPASGSLFGGAPSTAPTGLFGNKPPTGGSLFGQPPASGSLFSNAAAGPTLFKFSQPPAAKDAAEGDSGDDDDAEEGEKSPPIYADSTTKVNFVGGAQ